MVGMEAGASARFTPFLLPGEKVLWAGAPRGGLALTARDVFLVPFSLLWGGFAIFWEWGALSGKAPFPFALFGVPFVLIGLFLIVGRFFADAWLRSRTSYALTDRRVLIMRSGGWSAFKALNLDRLPEATLSGAGEGRGTIRFGAEARLWGAQGYGNGFAYWVPALDPTPQFLLIENAPVVFAMVQQRSQRGAS
jgi:hypothetical protein